MTQWSLDAELERLSGKRGRTEGLKKLGLLEASASEFELTHDEKWVRGGAETYIFRFWIETAGQRRGYMLKACTPSFSATSLNDILREWISRRAALAGCGVKTPELHFWGEGVLIEELIPFTLEEVLKKEGALRRGPILNDLIGILSCVHQLKFNPIDIFGDLRSRGTDAVMIDFGEDLGGQAQNLADRSKLLANLMQNLARWQVPVDEVAKLLLTSAATSGNTSTQ